LTEDAKPAPIEAYGRSKLEAERLVLGARVDASIVRPSAVYGPHDKDFLAMFRLAARGLAIHPGNRDQWISIAHVDDVARGVALASTHPDAIGRTFFLANDEPVQWRSLFQATTRCAGRTLRADFEVPRWLVRAAASVGDAVSVATERASLFTSGKAALAAPPFWTCSADRIRRELGFTSTIPLDQGLAETYAWYRANRWL
jgi:nucleoside-diphosphate-sugar epimerase